MGYVITVILLVGCLVVDKQKKPLLHQDCLQLLEP